MLDKTGHQGFLADALITHGIALARLGKTEQAQFTLQRAVNTAHQVGALNKAGMAALTMIEEIEGLAPDVLEVAYDRASEWLATSQSQEVLQRVIAVSKKIRTNPSAEVDAENVTGGLLTTYNYNPDDTVQSVSDARGASATYGYNNNRHLVNTITYSAPSGIAATPNVSFEYDPAGNRTSMTDGVGSVSYGYNQLSQMTSEARTITSVGTFPLNYDYNLAGELKKITDSTNTTINYNYDTAGRLGSVTGSDNLYGGVSQYASGLSYRAWGGVKGLTYGNNYTLAVSYNSRLQGTQFEVAGRPSQYGASTVMKTQFDYYADGGTKYAHDLLDERFDRAYSYDHVAMLKDAYTGSESRDYVNGTNSGTQTGPYRQSYQHDAFENMTHRDNRFWSQGDSLTASYTNHRRAGFSYDAEGRLTQDNDLQYHYDAAGRSISIISAATNTTITPSYEGLGQVVKRSENQSGQVTTTYYLRASVLGGQIVAELNAQGQKQKGHVFLGGRELAAQENNTVTWKHENPVTGSQGNSATTGFYTPAAELDPVGVNMGFEDPYLNSGGGGGLTPEIPTLIGGNSSGTCIVDGMSFDCDIAMILIGSGAAAPCPNNDCGPRFNVNRDGTGRSGWEILHLGPNGFFYDPLGPSTLPLGSRPPTLGTFSPGGNTGAEALDDEGLEHVNDFIIPVAFGVPQKTQITPCDRKFASIFGGKDSVGRTSYDYAGQYRGYDAAAEARVAGNPRSDFSNPLFDIEHLYWFPHLSGNLAGTENTDAYVPGNYVRGSVTRPTPRDAVVTVYYKNFFGRKNVTLAAFHIRDFSPQLEGGRLRIGTTGGPGGDESQHSPNNPDKHAHYELWKGRGYRPPGAGRDAARIPLTPVICP